MPEGILNAWAATVSEGMLPNRFADSGTSAEFNSADASLWFIVAAKDFLDAARGAGYRAGPGIFESEFIGLGMMVKDSGRFARNPGHWGYFSFGHKPPPYESSARPSGNCVGCHVNLASDTDYVISRAHIGLAHDNPH